MKILVIRFSSIGDIILTSPVVRWLKIQKNAEIHFLTKKAFESIISTNPYVSKVFGYGDDLPLVTKKLKEESYDLVVDLHKNLRSKSIVSRLGKKSIHFHKENFNKWLLVNFKIDRMPPISIVDRYAQALEALRVKNDGDGLDYFIADHANLATSLPNDPFYCISLSGTYYTKQIPKEKLEEIIKNLPYKCILLGGSNEIELGEILQQTFPEKVINFAGKTSLDETAEAIKNCTVLLTGDTATMHMAAALDISQVVLWGNTTPKLGMFPYYRTGSTKVWLSMEVDVKCRPCSKLGHQNCPKGHFKCMKQQSVSTIVENIKSIGFKDLKNPYYI